MKPLCIYHGNCADGFGSAWVVWKYFGGEVDFYPGVYQRPPPDVKDRFVIMVDFSYKFAVLEKMTDEAHAILILDHHKTAQQDLQICRSDHYRSYEQLCQELDRQRFTIAVFDMNRSGAGLTWDFFHPGEMRPRLLNHIEDRDLWKFALPDTREIQAFAFSQPYNFEVWDKMIEKFERYDEYRHDAIEQGAAIERKHFKDIEELVEVVTRPMRFRIGEEYWNGVVRDVFAAVPMANLPYTLTSDAGHLLLDRDYWGQKHKDDGAIRQEILFAGCYWDTPHGRQFSLRSKKGGFDVSEVARHYGGGGHKEASGFLVPFSRLSEFEP